MERLLANAQRILEMAELGAAQSITILIRSGRPVEINQSNDWRLESLLIERNADEVYRVFRKDGRLAVEGRDRSRTVLLSQRQNVFQMSDLRRIAEDDVHDVESQKMPIRSRASGIFERRTQHVALFFQSYCTIR